MLIEPTNLNTFQTDPTLAGQSENNMAEKSEESWKIEQEQPEEDTTKLAEKVVDVQKSLDIVQDTELQFSIHKGTGEKMITVTDRSSGELVREIPSKEFLDLAAKIDQMIGLIFDKTA